MKLLIVYEDECPYNPIIYAGRIRDDAEPDEAIAEQVKMAIVDVGINLRDTKVSDIVYDLMGMANFCWTDEQYCFAIKQI